MKTMSYMKSFCVDQTMNLVVVMKIGRFGLLTKKIQFFVFKIQKIQKVNTVDESTPTSKVNFAVPIGDEQGNTIVNTYDWLSYFAKNGSRKIPHITKFNHFEFNNSHKGFVHCKKELQDNVLVHKIFPTVEGPAEFPNLLVPQGLSNDRRHYLYSNIRQYCKDEFKDLLCPKVTSTTTNNNDNADDPGAMPGPSCPKKRKRST